MAYPAAIAIQTFDPQCTALPGPIELTGAGTQGEVSISATTLAFGSDPNDPDGLVNCGATGLTHTLKVVNNGSQVVNITGLSLGLGANSPFALSGPGASIPAAIPIGGAVTLEVTPAPIPAIVANPNDPSPVLRHADDHDGRDVRHAARRLARDAGARRGHRQPAARRHLGLRDRQPRIDRHLLERHPERRQRARADRVAGARAPDHLRPEEQPDHRSCERAHRLLRAVRAACRVAGLHRSGHARRHPRAGVLRAASGGVERPDDRALRLVRRESADQRCRAASRSRRRSAATHRPAARASRSRTTRTSSTRTRRASRAGRSTRSPSAGPASSRANSSATIVVNPKVDCPRPGRAAGIGALCGQSHRDDRAGRRGGREQQPDGAELHRPDLVDAQRSRPVAAGGDRDRRRTHKGTPTIPPTRRAGSRSRWTTAAPRAPR